MGKDKSTTINGYEGITNYLLITGSGAWLWCKAFLIYFAKFLTLFFYISLLHGLCVSTYSPKRIELSNLGN